MHAGLLLPTTYIVEVGICIKLAVSNIAAVYAMKAGLHTYLWSTTKLPTLYLRAMKAVVVKLCD